MMTALVGTTMRLVWVVDPFYSIGFLKDWQATLLLRLPQILWFVSYSLILVAWDTIISAAHPNRKASCQTRMVLFFLLAVIVGASVPATVLWSMGNTTLIVRSIADLSFGVYAVGCLVFGLVYGARVFRLLEVHLRFSTQSQQHRLLRIMEHTLVTILAAAILSAALVSAVAANILFDWTPAKAPAEFVGFMFMVHAFVEPGFAWTLAYASWHYTSAPSSGRGQSRSAVAPSSDRPLLPSRGDGGVPYERRRCLRCVFSVFRCLTCCQGTSSTRFPMLDPDDSGSLSAADTYNTGPRFGHGAMSIASTDGMYANGVPPREVSVRTEQWYVGSMGTGTPYSGGFGMSAEDSFLTTQTDSLAREPSGSRRSPSTSGVGASAHGRYA